MANALWFIAIAACIYFAFIFFVFGVSYKHGFHASSMLASGQILVVVIGPGLFFCACCCAVVEDQHNQQQQQPQQPPPVGEEVRNRDDPFLQPSGALGAPRASALALAV